MKPSLRKTLAVLPLAAACAAFGSAAHAQTIDFEGAVTGTSCTPSIAGGNNVTLPTIAISDFVGVNQPAAQGETTFSVQFTGCAPSGGITTAKVWFYHDVAGTVNNGRLVKVGGSGLGWEYELQAGASGNNPITIGTSATYIPNANDPGANITGGSGTAAYRVRYFQSAGVTAGNMTASVKYVVYYV